jgi:hypothetical protein
LSSIEFISDARFVVDREFSYVGIVSERYPRMTPVFPLLFVQILLGNWEKFTDSEAESCNPVMSSTAVSDEEEEVIDEGDEAGGIRPKPSPLDTLDEIMDELINTGQVAKRLNFDGSGGADHDEARRPSSPVVSALFPDGSTFSPPKPPAGANDDDEVVAAAGNV